MRRVSALASCTVRDVFPDISRVPLSNMSFLTYHPYAEERQAKEGSKVVAVT